MRPFSMLERKENTMKRFYTAESVTEGHPDKVCDQIAGRVRKPCRYQQASVELEGL